MSAAGAASDDAMLIARTAVLALAVLAVAPAAARAQAPVVRLAGASDCPVNPNCIPGFKRVYGFDPSGSFVKLAVADGGIEALDDGLAEVAVAFSSNPELSRPDILALRDDLRAADVRHRRPDPRLRRADARRLRLRRPRADRAGAPRGVPGRAVHADHRPARHLPGPAPARRGHPRPPARRARPVPALGGAQPQRPARDLEPLRAPREHEVAAQRTPDKLCRRRGRRVRTGTRELVS